MSDQQPAALSEEELALRSGTTVERVRRFRELGIVQARESDGYGPNDVLRVRLTLALEGSGLAAEDLGRGIERGAISLGFADLAVREPIGLLGETYRGYAEEIGMPLSLLQRILGALGIPAGRLDQQVREDDAELMRIAVFASATGLSDDALMRSLRVFTQHLRRIVEFELEIVREQFEDPVLLAGLSERELLERMAVARAQLEPVTGRVLELLHRRHEEHFFFQDVTQHVEAALEKAGVARPRAWRPPAIAVLQLPGGETATGDADRNVRLWDVVERVTLGHHGRPERLTGDAITLHFTDPKDAVRGALELVEEVANADMAAPRVGIHAGPVVVRDGEYFGQTVNLAARVAEYARAREVLATAEVLVHANVPGVGYEEIGPVTLRGIPGAMKLFLLSG